MIKKALKSIYARTKSKEAKEQRIMSILGACIMYNKWQNNTKAGARKPPKDK